MKEITTFKQIKKIIEPIPADKFCKYEYANSQGQFCFLGHIHQHINKTNNGDENGFGARRLTSKFIKEVFGLNASGVSVNNSNDVNGYNEEEIKDRLMHMIEDGIVWEEETK